MQFQFPSMSRMNKVIVISFVVLFILSAILKSSEISLVYYLGISPGAILSGRVWSFITYAFIPNSLMECLFDGLIFWFIGSELENLWGEARYLSFLLITVVGAACLYLALGFLFFSNSPLFSIAYSGPAGIASTMCVAYGILFPKRTMYFFFFPMQARWFVMLLVAMNLYNGFFTPGAIFAWAQIAAIVSGVLWMVFVSHPELKNILKSSSQAPERPFARSKKRSSKISHLHIVEDSDDDEGKPPTYH